MSCCYTEAMPLDVKPAVKRTEITYEELSRMVDAGMLHLIDVREPADVNETGIIKSAVNIPCMINSCYFLDCIFQSAFTEWHAPPYPNDLARVANLPGHR